MKAVEQVTVRVLPDGRLDRKNAAAYLGRAPKTLAQWKLQGRGPKSVTVNGREFYYLEVLEDYVENGDGA